MEKVLDLIEKFKKKLIIEEIVTIKAMKVLGVKDYSFEDFSRQ